MAILLAYLHLPGVSSLGKPFAMKDLYGEGEMITMAGNNNFLPGSGYARQVELLYFSEIFQRQTRLW
jgi:hypothetical protein